MATCGPLNNLQNFGPCTSGAWNWTFPQIICSRERKKHKYAVLVLNRPITQAETFFRHFWNDATVRVTVDGGTRKYDSFVSNLPQEVEPMKLPDLITGDFDSINDTILDKYKKKGCKIQHTPDQDYTDFTKALMELYKYTQETQLRVEHIVAVGQSSGRIDQILGNIQTLFLARDKHLLSPHTRVYILADDSISWLLSPGHHSISIPKETLRHKKAWCSLVPIGEPCETVTTTGLKWNLDRRPLQFGDLVSTSNTFDGSQTVNVTVSHTVLWSMKLPAVNEETGS